METIDLESMAIFKAVVEEGGVVRAAAKLHRVPSNVTKRIRQLEEYLGVRLFRRQGRTLSLSAEGRTLHNYSLRLLRLADEAVNELRTGKARGTFRLGALESTAGTRLAPILSRYHAEFPGVVVELVTGTTGNLINRVVNFDIEAAFVSEPFISSELTSAPVFNEELVLITSKQTTNLRKAGLFAGFIATMKRSDFSCPCFIGFDSSPSRRGPLQHLKRPSRRSPGSRTKSVPTCQVLRPRRAEQALALSRLCVLPSATLTASAP